MTVGDNPFGLVAYGAARAGGPRRIKFTRVQPRPCHPKTDAAAQDIFKKTSLAW